jgi:hypothetical protein
MAVTSMMRHDFGKKTSNGSVENFMRATSVSLGPACPSSILCDGGVLQHLAPRHRNDGTPGMVLWFDGDEDRSCDASKRDRSNCLN